MGDVRSRHTGRLAEFFHDRPKFGPAFNREEIFKQASALNGDDPLIAFRFLGKGGESFENALDILFRRDLIAIVGHAAMIPCSAEDEKGPKTYGLRRGRDAQLRHLGPERVAEGVQLKGTDAHLSDGVGLRDMCVLEADGAGLDRDFLRTAGPLASNPRGAGKIVELFRGALRMTGMDPDIIEPVCGGLYKIR